MRCACRGHKSGDSSSRAGPQPNEVPCNSRGSGWPGSKDSIDQPQTPLPPPQKTNLPQTFRGVGGKDVGLGDPGLGFGLEGPGALGCLGLGTQVWAFTLEALGSCNVRRPSQWDRTQDS